MTPNQPQGCNPNCEPWIGVSHCGLFTFSQTTGEVFSVKCPSMNCFGQMAKLVNGRMASHDSPMDTPDGRKCPWIGIRVVNDMDASQRGQR